VGRFAKEKAMKFPAFVALGLALLTLPADANPNCLRIGQIWSWKSVDKRTLIVEDQLYQKFKVSLQGFCPALPYKLALGFKSIGGINGLDCLERGDEVISHDVGVRYTCPIMSITPYTPAMENADKAAAAAQP
jgi:hypothetical protein